MAAPCQYAGQTFSHYRIIESIGAGGMGVVYRARDERLNRDVAVKVIPPNALGDEQTRKRLRKEALILSQLNHPNVASIYDFDSQDGIDFIVMELVEGTTLTQKIADGPICESESLHLTLQVLDGLQEAHSLGIVHRDLKPSNIIVRENQHLKVLDFGLATIIKPIDSNSTESLVQPDQAAGTLPYMAPELLQGHACDARTDIWSLGVLMYEMVSGTRPFRGQTAYEVSSAILRSDPPSLPPDLSAGFKAVVSRCLLKEPGRRFQTAGEVRAALSSFDAPPQRDRLLRRLGLRRISKNVWGLILLSLVALVLSFVFLDNFWTNKAVPFAERDWILVADFKNQTGEAIFDRVVGDLVGEALSQSSYVNVVPRLTVIEAAKRTGLADVKEIDGDLGRQIALRERYRAVLAGEITKSGGTYQIKMTVMDPRSGTTVLNDTASIRSPDELYSAVDHMSSRVRQRLGESISKLELSKPLAQVTTPSLEALQRYSLALELYGAKEFVRSIALAKDATDRDPDFAMAHLLLARAYDQIGDGTNSRAQFHLARGTSGHAGERERHLILASDYSAQGQDQKSADEYQHLLDIYPDDIEALRGLADSLFWTGRIAEAINTERRALQLSPYSVIDYGQMMTLLIRNSQFADALEIFDRGRSRGLDNPNLRFNAALALWGMENLKDAQSKFDQLKEESSDYWKVVAQLYSGRLLAYQGRMAEAEEVLRSGLVLVERPGLENWTPVFRYLLARIEMERGRTAQARAEAQGLASAAKSVSSPENLQRAGSLAIAFGDINGANQFRQLIKKGLASQYDAFTEMHFYNLSGDIDLANRRFDAAVQNQQQALTFYEGFAAYRSLGQACEESREWKCAVDAYTNYLHLKGEIIRDDFAADWVIAHYLLARVLAKSGNPAAAQNSYDAFFKLFSASDRNLPVVQKAQRESKRLRSPKINN